MPADADHRAVRNVSEKAIRGQPPSSTQLAYSAGDLTRHDLELAGEAVVSKRRLGLFAIAGKVPGHAIWEIGCSDFGEVGFGNIVRRRSRVIVSTIGLASTAAVIATLTFMASSMIRPSESRWPAACATGHRRS